MSHMSAIFNFDFFNLSHLHISNATLWSKPYFRLDIWLWRYERFFKFKNNVKHKNLTPIKACNSKSIFPTCDSFPLIMSTIEISPFNLFITPYFIYTIKAVLWVAHYYLYQIYQILLLCLWLRNTSPFTKDSVYYTYIAYNTLHIGYSLSTGKMKYNWSYFVQI